MNATIKNMSRGMPAEKAYSQARADQQKTIDLYDTENVIMSMIIPHRSFNSHKPLVREIKSKLNQLKRIPKGNGARYPIVSWLLEKADLEQPKDRYTFLKLCHEYWEE
jgi:hypothetical protein